MNNTMGRYIDGLTAEQRDRLVEAKDFLDDDWWDGVEGVGCLCCTAEGGWSDDLSNVGVDHPAYRFPQACDRFGKARVVRAIKLRAGAKVESLAVLAHA